MDKSKEYVKMCEASHQIQLMRRTEKGFSKLEPGDWIQFQVEGQEAKVIPIYSFVPKFWTWLPRTDQIQDLVWGWVDEISFALQKGIIEFNTYNLSGTDSSFEKIWLRVYMREQHNCLWDKEALTWENRG